MSKFCVEFFMRENKNYLKTIIAGIFIGFLSLVSVEAQSSVVKNTKTILLGDTAVKINVYEKEGEHITFFAPHFNEQTGTKIVKELIEKRGGKLIEIESFDENGNSSRYIKFKFREGKYSIDPNRIFTENGRRCGNSTPEINFLINEFSNELLKIIFPPTGSKLSIGEEFLVAVHNNSDVDDARKSESAKAADLTAYAFAKYSKIPASLGEFYEQADGVYLSNTESDADNFFFLSTPKYIGFFAERGFNVALQKSSAGLQSKNCHVDDGSLSVFAGQQKIPYINIEADAVNGSLRQRQMIETVYELLKISSNSAPADNAVKGKGGEVNK